MSDQLRPWERYQDYGCRVCDGPVRHLVEAGVGEIRPHVLRNCAGTVQAGLNYAEVITTRTCEAHYESTMDEYCDRYGVVNGIPARMTWRYFWHSMLWIWLRKPTRKLVAAISWRRDADPA